ncbi:MAG: universal stress protein [Desulfobacterales bacterium]|jgi:nucleotide-binding universal stress UspA family protein
MIPKIRKILYATDLTPNSAYAFRYALHFASQNDAKIIILHVFESISTAVRAHLEFSLNAAQRKKIFNQRSAYTLDRIKRRLSKFSDKELMDASNAEKRIESIDVCEGFAADAILEKADELKCDVIVMGTHGKGLVAHTFLGSVAKRVLRRSRIPIFIIPLPKGETDVTVHDE